MDPNTYRTIMIGHTLVKLYGAVMEELVVGMNKRARYLLVNQARAILVDMEEGVLNQLLKVTMISCIYYCI